MAVVSLIGGIKLTLYVKNLELFALLLAVSGLVISLVQT